MGLDEESGSVTLFRLILLRYEAAPAAVSCVAFTQTEASDARRPISIRRRMASERRGVSLRLAAHASMIARISAETCMDVAR
jgi:hypothetical protein